MKNLIQVPLFLVLAVVAPLALILFVLWMIVDTDSAINYVKVI